MLCISHVYFSNASYKVNSHQLKFLDSRGSLTLSANTMFHHAYNTQVHTVLGFSKLSLLGIKTWAAQTDPFFPTYSVSLKTAISGAAMVLCRGLQCLLLSELSSLFPQVLGHMDTIISLQADFTERCSILSL